MTFARSWDGHQSIPYVRGVAGETLFNSDTKDARRPLRGLATLGLTPPRDNRPEFFQIFNLCLKSAIDPQPAMLGL